MAKIKGTNLQDLLNGTSGADVIDAGGGNDTVNAGAGNDTVTGGTGNDLIYGEAGHDKLSGDDGNDRLDGGAGDDSLDGGSGNDVLLGGEGNDTIAGGTGNDTLFGGAGNDKITGGKGNDSIDGGAGDDSISGGGGADLISGGDGNDKITGGKDDDVIDGGAGDDSISGGGGADLISGGAGNDKITGGKGNDSIDGGADNDSIDAKGGNDVVLGGAGNDTVSGGAGADSLFGGEGADVLRGDGGGSGSGSGQSFNDYLDGGAGNDLAIGGQGNDAVLGGAGNDVLYGDAGAGSGSGAGSGRAGSGRGGSGHGGSGHGGSGSGGSGSGSGQSFNDYLDGGAGNDALYGQQGNDIGNYTGVENLGASDYYDGGLGVDTLRLTLTYGEYTSAAFQADLAAFNAFLAVNSNPNGDNGPLFQFTSFDLDVRDWEGVNLVLTNVGPTANADANATTEDNIATGNVLGNDTDPDYLDQLSVVSFQAASALGGTVTVAANGGYSYDPTAVLQHLAQGAVVTDTFSYTISDLAGATSSATATITVTGTNDGPVAVADTAAGTENQALLIDVLANDTDVDDGHVLSVASVDSVSGGGSASVSANQVAFDPGADFDHLNVGHTASVTVSYTMADEHGATSSSTATITVTGTNDGPVAVADTAGGTENEALLIDVLANDTDVDDGHSFTLSSVDSVSGGGAAAVDANQVSFEPSTDFDHLNVGDTASVEIAYTMADEHGATSSATATITVTGVNDGPVANDDEYTATGGGGGTSEVLSFDDYSLLNWNWTTNPDGVNGFTYGDYVFGTAAYYYDWNFGTGGNGADTAVAWADYGYYAPSIARIDGADFGVSSLNVGQAYYDFGPGGFGLGIEGYRDGQLVASTLAYPEYAGYYYYSEPFTHVDLPAEFGQIDLLVFRDAFDSYGGYGNYITYDEIVIGGGNTTENFTADFDVLANDTDIDDGAVLSVVSVQGTSALGATVTINPDGTVHYDSTNAAAADALAEGETADDTFSYVMTDEHGATSSATVTVHLTGVNDRPVANADVAAGDENEALLIDVLANDTDVDNGHSFTLVSASAVSGGAASVDANQVAFDPGTSFDYLNVGDTAIATVNYTMADEHGATSSSTVTITVTGTNDGPVANDDSLTGVPDGFTLNPDNGHFYQWVTAGMSFHDAMANAHALGGYLATVTSAQENAFLDALMFNSGNFTWIGASDAASEGDWRWVDGPEAGQQFWVGGTGGTATQYAAWQPGSEPNNAGNEDYAHMWGGGYWNDLYDAGLYSFVEIGGIPGDATGNGFTDEDTARTFSESFLLSNDTDVDQSHVLNVVSVSSASAAGASVSLSAGQITYDPLALFQHLAEGEIATDTFTYVVADEHGATSSATVTIEIGGVNDGPVANNDTASTNEDAFVAIASATLLANDTDADGGDTKTLVSVGGAVNGAVSLAGSVAYFTPNVDYNGPASFTYTMRDAAGATSSATVSVTVNPVNDAPVANNDTASTNEDTPLTISHASLLANDTDVDAGDTKTITSVGLVVNGTVGISAGSLLFSPAANFSGTASFRYTMQDGAGATSSATVSVTVNPVNDAPDIGHSVLGTLVNGSFEAGSAGYYTGGSTALTGWTVTGTDIDRVPSSTWQSANGTYSLDLNGFNSGGVSQSLATTAGVEYAVTFSMAANPNSTSARTVQVSAGSESATFSATAGTHTSMGWTPHTFTFTATGAATTLAFASQNGTANGPTLDAVSLTALGVGTNEDIAVTVGGLSVSDIDAGSNPILVSLSVAHGDLALVSSAGLTFVDSNGSDGTLSFTGSQAALNAALASGVVYAPDANYNGTDALVATVNDQGHTGAGGAGADSTSVAINVHATNDAPVAEADKMVILPAGKSVSSLNISAPTDLDGDILTAQVLSLPTNGTIRLGGVAVTAGQSLSMANLAALTFDAGANPSNSSFTYQVQDGHGGTDTATINTVVLYEYETPETTVLTFDDIAGGSANVPTGYGGFDWSVDQLGFGSLEDILAGGGSPAQSGNSAWNGYGSNVGHIVWQGSDAITFDGAYFLNWSGASSVTVKGYNNGVELFSTSFAPGGWRDFDWVGIDALTVDAGADSRWWTIDNFTYSTQVADTLATVLTFDDIAGGSANVPTGYGGFNWSVDQLGFGSLEDILAGGGSPALSGNSAWNGYGSNVGHIDWQGTGTITFEGAYFLNWSGASSITVKGYNNGAELFSTSFAPGGWRDFDWAGIDALTVDAGADSRWWTIDNFTFSTVGFDDLTLVGGAGNDVLAGGGGDDTLTGNAGNDSFVFSDGGSQDRIADFQGGAGAGDVLDLSGVAGLNTFADVQARMSQVGADTLIDLNGTDEVRLVGVTAANLVADDFLV
ncbi:MAG: choice-of-anchor C family protein [Alphaproteobacteria bacterium]